MIDEVEEGIGIDDFQKLLRTIKWVSRGDDELQQVAYLRVLNMMEVGDDRKGVGYLIKAAKNAIIDHCRKKRMFFRVHVTLEDDIVVYVEEDFASTLEARQIIEMAIARAGKYRWFIEKWLEDPDLSPTNVARKCGMSPATASRAMQHIRAIVSDIYKDSGQGKMHNRLTMKRED